MSTAAPRVHAELVDEHGYEHLSNMLAKDLKLAYPDAAVSLREGLHEMFTVACLGAISTLRRSLTTTNPIKSMIAIPCTTARVKKLA